MEAKIARKPACTLIDKLGEVQALAKIVEQGKS